MVEIFDGTAVLLPVDATQLTLDFRPEPELLVVWQLRGFVLFTTGLSAG